MANAVLCRIGITLAPPFHREFLLTYSLCRCLNRVLHHSPGAGSHRLNKDGTIPPIRYVVPLPVRATRSYRYRGES
ncbi:hypothetical protein CBM2592_A130041 [Cupriavidus taiwanensis]|nr:hypothetical protein CBM2588_A110041 [Cupriavidus taiwanensis]SOY44695.1 hypothetical protein CBM2592_A130041 [Cupriavidus taiwanensis]SOY80624.1 hypothetical protein CBM2591_A170003 [Cupriavidus taiwanensis]SOZ21527.1 hypothetical protein CBM2608_A150003 [Cupriavidus taiwanensis]SOZ52304.1 hypothetical protein CBM2617_A150004 [Cupriavidus taiwanensis]